MNDIRNDADETAIIRDGTLYRKGGTIQVWWTQDIFGRPFSGDSGRETWTLPDSEWGIREAQQNFDDMKERWR